MCPDWIRYARRGGSRTRDLLDYAMLGLKHVQDGAQPEELNAYRGEVERRETQFELIDQIEGTELLIEHYGRHDRREVPRLWRRLARLNREMIAISDPDEVHFFRLKPVPDEYSGSLDG